jgi:hypothetical protein
MVYFTLVLNRLLNQLSSKSTESMQLSVSVNLLLTFCELLTNRTKQMDKNMYGIVLCCVLYTVGNKGWKGTCRGNIISAEQ